MLLIHMYVLFTTMFAVNMFERKLSHVKVEKRRVNNLFFYISRKMVLFLQILKGCQGSSYLFKNGSSFSNVYRYGGYLNPLYNWG